MKVSVSFAEAEKIAKFVDIVHRHDVAREAYKKNLISAETWWNIDAACDDMEIEMWEELGDISVDPPTRN